MITPKITQVKAATWKMAEDQERLQKEVKTITPFSFEVHDAQAFEFMTRKKQLLSFHELDPSPCSLKPPHPFRKKCDKECRERNNDGTILSVREQAKIREKRQQNFNHVMDASKGKGVPYHYVPRKSEGGEKVGGLLIINDNVDDDNDNDDVENLSFTPGWEQRWKEKKRKRKVEKEKSKDAEEDDVDDDSDANTGDSKLSKSNDRVDSIQI